MNKEELLKIWSEKLSLSVEEIQTEFDIISSDVMYNTLEPEEKEKRALQRLALIYKKQLRSPAVGFEGVIIGIADCVDIVARQRREAIDMFKNDPQTAVTEGVTDEEGTPLDTRQIWSTGNVNQGYGKPLPEHNYLRNIYGIAKKSKGTDEPKFFAMMTSGVKAEDETIPIFKPVRFMAIDKSEDGDSKYNLNASSFTTFNETNDFEIKDIKGILSNKVEVVPINGLAIYHDHSKEDWNRLAVVEGDVSAMNLEPTSFGSRILSIDDPEASMEDLDTKGLTCWLPPRIKIDFAEGSKVLVVGRTGQGNKKVDGVATNELADVTMNVFGVYALPEYKISLPEEIEPISEDDI